MPIREIKKMDPLLRRFLPPQQPQPGVRYRPSQFALRVEERVWNSLTQQCLETALPDAAMAGEGYDDLIRSYFLVPEDKDECRFYEALLRMVRAFQRKPGCHGYIILPTTGCNARCVYCYEQGMIQTAMTPEVVRQTIRYILDTHADETVSLGWFGGEPLLRPDVIDAICASLAEANVPYKSSMITNGSLITPQIIGQMAGLWRLKTIQLSMDGDEADYIRRKRYIQSGNQYRTVLGAVSELAEAGIHVIVRCNVDMENWDTLQDFFSDLKATVRDRSRVGVYLCPLDAVRSGPDDIALWRRVLETNAALGREGFAHAQSICGSGRFRTTHCMADMNRVAIGPDGSLFACERCPAEARFGDIWHHVTDPDAKQAFGEIGPTREKCRQCPYLPICTPFSACPVQDTHCREIRDLALPDFVRGLDGADTAVDEEVPC